MTINKIIKELRVPLRWRIAQIKCHIGLHRMIWVGMYDKRECARGCGHRDQKIMPI